MNKRQQKKRDKIIKQRVKYFNTHIICSGRQSGKTNFLIQVNRACFNKKYKPFKILKKMYSKLFIGIDFSNGKDYSVKTTCRINNGIVKILKSEILS